MTGTVQVLVVDDQPDIRAIWQRLICRQPDMTLVETLPSADDLAASAPDDAVVLMDLSMPGRDPLAVVAELRETGRRCRVVVFSGYTDARTVRESLEAGAWGFVDKVAPPLEILDAIRRVASGETAFPPGALLDAGDRRDPPAGSG